MFGTVTRAGRGVVFPPPPCEVVPFATLSRTFEPFAAVAPPLGDWLTTVPAACVEGTANTFGARPDARTFPSACARGSPVTSGTATFGGPFETVSATVAPRASFQPAGGFCAVTVPAGFGEGAELLLRCRPAAWSFAAASADVIPPTFGT